MAIKWTAYNAVTIGRFVAGAVVQVALDSASFGFGTPKRPRRSESLASLEIISWRLRLNSIQTKTTVVPAAFVMTVGIVGKILGGDLNLSVGWFVGDAGALETALVGHMNRKLTRQADDARKRSLVSSLPRASSPFAEKRSVVLTTTDEWLDAGRDVAVTTQTDEDRAGLEALLASLRAKVEAGGRISARDFRAYTLAVPTLDDDSLIDHVQESGLEHIDKDTDLAQPT